MVITWLSACKNNNDGKILSALKNVWFKVFSNVEKNQANEVLNSSLTVYKIMVLYAMKSLIVNIEACASYKTLLSASVNVVLFPAAVFYYYENRL